MDEKTFGREGERWYCLCHVALSAAYLSNWISHSRVWLWPGSGSSIPSSQWPIFSSCYAGKDSQSWLHLSGLGRIKTHFIPRYLTRQQSVQTGSCVNVTCRLNWNNFSYFWCLIQQLIAGTHCMLNSRISKYIQLNYFVFEFINPWF